MVSLNNILRSLPLPIVVTGFSELVTLLSGLNVTNPWAAFAVNAGIFVFTYAEKYLVTLESQQPTPVVAVSAATPSPSAVKASPGSVTSTSVPTPSVTPIPVNGVLANQIMQEGYNVYVNPTMPDGIVYGIGSPAGFTYWSTQSTAPILVLGPGVVGSPPGTGVQLAVPA